MDSTSMVASSSTNKAGTVPQQQLSLCTTPSPARVRPISNNVLSMDSAVYHRYLLDRRKSFRLRGSLGPTVASAPSVELEDYRTPKPVVSDIKNGKSFDFGGAGANALNASDNNALIKVSTDFLRLNGSRQQFRNLLSARKKLGTMPPAYTRIDISHESIDSNGTLRHQGPMITVEDTGSQLKITRNKSSTTSSAFDSQKSSIDKGFHAFGNGANHLSFERLKRNNSRYGVPIDGSAAKLTYRIRSERLKDRVQINDRCLALAVLGIMVMVIDSEITGQMLFGISKSHPVSLMLRALVTFSTVLLVLHIVHYHVNEVKLEMVDCGADDWRVVLSFDRISLFISEIVLCSICPLPGTGNLCWTFMESSRIHRHVTSKEVPLDVVLSLLMLGRVYLIGRFMVLHSKQFQDASTRTLAALNRIQVNFSFVMKTVLDQEPIRFLTAFTLIFWATTAWTFVQCERYGRDESPSIMYSNAMWFIAITFMLNGYGDIVPQTHCGRIIAILVGVVGAIVSSILIAVISRKILLSQGQRNVNNFMDDSRLTRQHKHAAACVLQHTWHIHKCLQNSDTINDCTLREHQRKFLKSIHYFRHVKNKMRVFNELSSTSLHQVSRLVSEMHSSMQRLVSAQEEMRAQVEVLQRAMRNHFTHHGSQQNHVFFAGN
uniref:Calmodulin-binding domain-containing protein n=1 Tax=Parascaris univalens TaxID=6257 RepID=A0A915AST1_PARUN